MRGFPVNGDPKPAELSRPPENPLQSWAIGAPKVVVWI
jgi:hypothetical protein